MRKTVSQMGRNPLMHSAMSSCGIHPHLDETRNSLSLSAPVFAALLKYLRVLAVTPRGLQSLVAERRKALAQRVEREMEAVGNGDLRARDVAYERARVRTFRTLTEHPAVETAAQTIIPFEFRRYVARYDQQRTDSESGGVSATYVVRVHYRLVHYHATARMPESWAIESACNATALDGESGSPFSSDMFTLEASKWAAKLADLYRKPYRMLEIIAQLGQVGTKLHALTKLGTDLGDAPRGDFSLQISDKQMLQAIRIQTFGFRWIATLDYKDQDPRQLMLLMLYTLYNARHQFQDREVEVASPSSLDVELHRKSSASDNMFDRRPDPKDQELETEAAVTDQQKTQRLARLFERQEADPIVGLRIRVKDKRRASRYTVSFHIPSTKYLKMLYSYTDGLRGPTTDFRKGRKLLDVWKEVAKRGLIIGVDAYSGYLRHSRNIHTLQDLLDLFINEYHTDIQRFCQRILESAYGDLDIEYWLSGSWMGGLRDLNIKDKGDAKVWEWLRAHPHLTIIDLMMQQGLFPDIQRDGKGRAQPKSQHLKQVLAVVEHWKEDYGYDPSYSLGAHIEVVKAWYHADSPALFYSAEVKGTPLASKVKRAQGLLSGEGNWLPLLVEMPLKPVAKPR